MDFIERFFHISPDGGSGTTELIWLAVALFAIASVLFRLSHRFGQVSARAPRSVRATEQNEISG